MSGAWRGRSGDRPLIRAPRRGARIAFAALVAGTLAIPVVREAVASASPAEPAGAAAAIVSTTPHVVIDGGTADRRQKVIAAVDRYVSVGLALPDLRIRVHDDGKAACGGFQGRFRPDGAVGVIDLCFGGEFLALHELGHAWERFNLDDRQRAEFQRFTGLTTWRSTDVTWHDRAAERTADAVAFGLLSVRLTNVSYHTAELAEFELLTGFESPRLADVETPNTTAPPLDDGQRARLAAYTEWRDAQTSV